VHGVESKREERGSSIVYRSNERANYRLIYKRERRKTACRLPKPERKAEYKCRALLTMGAGEAGGGGQPPASCPSPPASKTKEATGPNP
jgi:hypothetical protein